MTIQKIDQNLVVDAGTLHNNCGLLPLGSLLILELQKTFESRGEISLRLKTFEEAMQAYYRDDQKINLRSVVNKFNPTDTNPKDIDALTGDPLRSLLKNIILCDAHNLYRNSHAPTTWKTLETRFFELLKKFLALDEDDKVTIDLAIQNNMDGDLLFYSNKEFFVELRKKYNEFIKNPTINTLNEFIKNNSTYLDTYLTYTATGNYAEIVGRPGISLRPDDLALLYNHLGYNLEVYNDESYQPLPQYGEFKIAAEADTVKITFDGKRGHFKFAMDDVGQKNQYMQNLGTVERKTDDDDPLNSVRAFFGLEKIQTPPIERIHKIDQDQADKLLENFTQKIATSPRNVFTLVQQTTDLDSYLFNSSKVQKIKFYHVMHAALQKTVEKLRAESPNHKEFLEKHYQTTADYKAETLDDEVTSGALQEVEIARSVRSFSR